MNGLFAPLGLTYFGPRVHPPAGHAEAPRGQVALFTDADFSKHGFLF